MNVAMLWFDNDPKLDLDVKIKKATTYYQNRYGVVPDTCVFNPSMLPTLSGDAGEAVLGKFFPNCEYANITIRVRKYILPNHLWIGVERSNL